MPAACVCSVEYDLMFYAQSLRVFNRMWLDVLDPQPACVQSCVTWCSMPAACVCSVVCDLVFYAHSLRVFSCVWLDVLCPQSACVQSSVTWSSLIVSRLSFLFTEHSDGWINRTETRINSRQTRISHLARRPSLSYRGQGDKNSR